jgi:hypothetical protein
VAKNVVEIPIQTHSQWQQRCLGTLVPNLVVGKVKPRRGAAFKSLRYNLRAAPFRHAGVAKDLPAGRVSKLMFSIVELAMGNKPKRSVYETRVPCWNNMLIFSCSRHLYEFWHQYVY